MKLTTDQREAHVCALKPNLCRDEHYHEADVVRLNTDAYDLGASVERNRILRMIDERCLDLRHTGGHGICLTCHSIGGAILAGESA